MIMLPFGQTLFLWRRDRGLTQAELARRAGIPRPNLSAIEQGRHEVSLQTIRRLAAALQVRPGVLVDGVPPGAPEGKRLPELSRGTVERLANSAAFGQPVRDPGERMVVAALQGLLGHRTRAMRRQWSKPRTGRRTAINAWATLTSLYSRDAIQTLADRVLERQHADAVARH